MSPILDRSKREGPHLEWKVRIFTVGAGLALVGIFLDERWLTGVAIVVLASAMLLRFLPGATTDDGEADGDDDPA